MNLETLAVHAGREVEDGTHAVTPSITPATTFERVPDGAHTYTRGGNPNRDRLEMALAALEGGASCVAFASGQAATAAVLQTLQSGDHVVLPNDLYHGTRYLTTDIMARWGLEATFVEMSDLAQVEAVLRPNTRLIWIETPSNPRLRISDLRAIAALAQARGILSVADNTWATPIAQRPLELGVDAVMHSTTKYIGGHSDVLGGAVIVREGMPTWANALRDVQKLVGGVPSPFDCWLLSRSIPTLPYRVRAQSATAATIAAWLAQHPQVEVVHYPGLPTHPGHAVASGQMSLFGAMLSIQVRGGQDEALRVAGRTRLFTQATSLGGVESLIEHRASVEGPQTPTPPNLLRLSVGLEHVDDLIQDLAQALEHK